MLPNIRQREMQLTILGKYYLDMPYQNILSVSSLLTTFMSHACDIVIIKRQSYSHTLYHYKDLPMVIFVVDPSLTGLAARQIPQCEYFILA